VKIPSAASPPATTGKAVREEPLAAPARPIQNRPVQDKPVQDKPVRDKPVQDQDIAARSQGGAQVNPKEVKPNEVNPNEGVQAAKLVARASVLLEQGNIGAARIVLERAAEMGSARASFVLAETYDPLILPNFGTYGTQGDPTRAQNLYARAEAGGIKEAKARFEALRR
jgi:TPR repeat protein